MGYLSTVAMSCGVHHRSSSDPVWLWLWLWLAAAAPIPPLAWEHSHTTRVALKKKKMVQGEKIGKKHSALLLSLFSHWMNESERRCDPHPWTNSWTEERARAPYILTKATTSYFWLQCSHPASMRSCPLTRPLGDAAPARRSIPEPKINTAASLQLPLAQVQK